MILETYTRKFVLAGDTVKHVFYSRMVQTTTTSAKPCFTLSFLLFQIFPDKFQGRQLVHMTTIRTITFMYMLDKRKKIVIKFQRPVTLRSGSYANLYDL